MRLQTPRSEQGQTVERSYGWHDGQLYRHTLDRSDGAERWHRCHDGDLPRMQSVSYEAGGEDYPPSCRWIPCEVPDEDLAAIESAARSLGLLGEEV